MSTPPRHLLQNRSRPDERAALEDWCSENGCKFLLFRPHMANALNRLSYGDGGGGYGGGGGDGDDGYGGYGDGYGGYGDGHDGYDGYGGCDGYGDGGGDGDRALGDDYSRDETTKMKNGLKIISTPSGAYCYVRVGWLRRVDGDEFEIIGARVIRRFGTNAALSDIAETGPIKTTELLVASKYPEEVHRLQIERSITCNEQAWASECPKPEGWKDT